MKVREPIGAATARERRAVRYRSALRLWCAAFAGDLQPYQTARRSLAVAAPTGPSSSSTSTSRTRSWRTRHSGSVAQAGKFFGGELEHVTDQQIGVVPGVRAHAGGKLAGENI